uniref:Putative ovule protein n=1 Tax=Solanum chacoense TaxID=4108 RepID=A0A0V0GNN3_SOLCH
MTRFRTIHKISLDYQPEQNFRRSASRGDSLFNLMMLSMCNSVGRNFSLSYYNLQGRMSRKEQLIKVLIEQV